MTTGDISLASATSAGRRLSVAPMMDWTDRHCRTLHRLISKRALLYTEMITAAAIEHGDAERLLSFSEAEHPVALQIGGSEPELLAKAVRTALAFGYPEINLNVGCPSDRVQNGAFGACLMREPNLVAECAAAMINAAAGRAVITVKCRLGVDDQDVERTLPAFLDTVSAAGVGIFCIHARKAWLQGLSPKENRDIPPLDYALARRMKAERPDLNISVNGGVTSLEATEAFLADGFDGVMIGRAAYHDPMSVLAEADQRIFEGDAPAPDAEDVVRSMLPYIEGRLAKGDRLGQITRHMLGLFQGRPGARRWRRVLSEGAHKPGAGPRLVEEALSAIEPASKAA